MPAGDLLAAMERAAERLYGSSVRVVLGPDAEDDECDEATYWSANVLAVVGDRRDSPHLALEALATALRERLLSRADHDRAIAEQIATLVASHQAAQEGAGR
jgi:hypothetical protein